MLKKSTSLLKVKVEAQVQRITDETVKFCAYNFSEGPFLKAKRAIIDLTVRTI